MGRTPKVKGEGGDVTLTTHGKPIANPYVVLREEFDDWAVLFDPDTTHGFGLNPAGVYVWKLLDGEHAIDELLEVLRDQAKDVAEDAREHIRVFVNALVAQGLAGYSDEWSYREKYSPVSPTVLSEENPFIYEAPRLVNLSSGQAVNGATCSGHGSHGGDCSSGAGATGSCCTGTCGTPPMCCAGACPPQQCGSGAATSCICSCTYGVQAAACSPGTWPVTSCNSYGNFTGQC